jgi:uncharacterized protein YpbB
MILEENKNRESTQRPHENVILKRKLRAGIYNLLIFIFYFLAVKTDVYFIKRFSEFKPPGYTRQIIQSILNLAALEKP